MEGGSAFCRREQGRGGDMLNVCVWVGRRNVDKQTGW